MPVVGFFLKKMHRFVLLHKSQLKCNIHWHINQEAMQIQSDIKTEKE